jgi:hypothetical protein
MIEATVKLIESYLKNYSQKVQGPDGILYLFFGDSHIDGNKGEAELPTHDTFSYDPFSGLEQFCEQNLAYSSYVSQLTGGPIDLSPHYSLASFIPSRDLRDLIVMKFGVPGATSADLAQVVNLVTEMLLRPGIEAIRAAGIPIYKTYLFHNMGTNDWAQGLDPGTTRTYRESIIFDITKTLPSNTSFSIIQTPIIEPSGGKSYKGPTLNMHGLRIDEYFDEAKMLSPSCSVDGIHLRSERMEQFMEETLS